MKLKDRIIAVLSSSGKSLSFEKIYELLEKDGHPLPKDKPKLKVRQILYQAELFDVVSGQFTVKEGVEAEQPQVAKAEPKLTAVEPKALEKKAEAEVVKPQAEAGPKLKDRIITILKTEGKPLSFEKIYELLEKDGHPLPKDKPKLKVRQILYQAELFDVAGGQFTVKEGVEAEQPQVAKAEPKLTAVEPKALEKKAEVVKPQAEAGPKLKDRIITILKTEGKPLSFEKIYELLEKDGHPLPKDKPKLKVRQILYQAELFDVAGGQFTVKEGVEAEQPQVAKAEPIKNEAQPVPASMPKLEAVEPKVQSIPSAALKPEGQKPVESQPVQAISAMNEEFIAKAREEARKAALEFAAKAREDAIREAQEAARLAAAEVAREAAIEQARIAVAHEAARQAAIDAAIEAAREAAREAATREAARIAGENEARRLTQEAARIAGENEARRLAQEAARLAEENEAKRLTQEASKIESDKADAEILSAARAAREAARNAFAAMDSFGQNVKSTAAVPTRSYAKPPAQGMLTSAPAKDMSTSGSSGSSIRERAGKVILKAGRPLGFDEIFDALGSDGYPLPLKNAEQVVRRVLENKTIFHEVEPNIFFPIDT